MKKFFPTLLLTLLLSMVCAFHSKAQVQLRCHFFDQSIVEYEITPVTKVTFSPGYMHINSYDPLLNNSIPLAAIQKITLKDGFISKKFLTEDLVRIVPNPARDYFSIENDLTKNWLVKVISSNGQLLIDATYSTHEPIDISALLPGSYIVTVNNHPYKLIKQ